ncbi:hypothetical protein LTS01_026029, partial [Friedmanniomyces endolithicus]
MSRMRTAKPTTPPPAPICWELPIVDILSLASGAAKVRAARQSWRKIANMLV